MKIMKLPFLLSLFALLPLSSIQVINTKANEEERYINRIFESDVLTIKSNGFQRLFNEKASRNFEYGSYERHSILEFSFKGKSISIYGYKGNVGGQIRISIDNGKETYISSYLEGVNKYKTYLYSFDNLSDEEHTIKIVNDDNTWCAIDYFEVSMKYENYIKNYNLAQVGDIICSNPHPAGGGNKDLNVIRNEKIYTVGTSGFGPSQYDSFDGSGRNENVFYMGYTFNEPILLSKLVYQAGDYWNTGGWFKNGSLHVEACVSGTWITLSLDKDLGYPVGDTRDLFTPCGLYYFLFDPVLADGIRIIGDAGGSEHFVSVSQIEVYQNKDTLSLAEGANYRNNVVFD